MNIKDIYGFEIFDWSEYQEYQYPKPSWLRLHRSWLDDESFLALSLAARGLFFNLCSLASENCDVESGIVDMSVKEIADRLYIKEVKQLVTHLNELAASGFIGCIALVR